MTLLGIFPCKVKDIIFVWRGACKVDMRWELPHEVRIVMWGDFCMVEGTTQHEGMWGGCEVRIATWGKNVHTRWLLHGWEGQLTIQTQGGQRWEWLHEVRMVMQGDFCMVEGTSYTFPPKVISHPCEMAKLPQVDTKWLWMRCYLCDVQSANDEDFQKFPLIYFCKVTSHGYSHLASTLHDHFPPCMGILTLHKLTLWKITKVTLHDYKATQKGQNSHHVT